MLLLKPETSGLGTARRVEGMSWGSFVSLGVVKSKNIKPEMIPSLALQSFEYILTNGIWIDRKAGRILAGSAPSLFTPDLISGRAPQPTDAFHPVSRSLAANRPLARWPGSGLAGLFLDLNLLGCHRTSERPNRHTTHRQKHSALPPFPIHHPVRPRPLEGTTELPFAGPTPDQFRSLGRSFIQPKYFCVS